MRKITSLFFAGIMLFGITPTLLALETNDYTAGTTVQYISNEEANESWTITVPALLLPGQEGVVTLDGTWPSNKLLTVTSESNVTLANNINPMDSKVLDITFLGISKAGSNTNRQTFTEKVSVAPIQNALFGTWRGHFNYNVSSQVVVSDTVNQMSLTITNPSSTNPNNPSSATNTQYTVSGYASADNGIKSVEVEYANAISYTVTRHDYMGGRLVLAGILPDEEANALVGNTAMVTLQNGETKTFTITGVGSWMSGGVYTNTYISYSTYYDINGGDVITVSSDNTVTIPGEEIGGDGLWHCDIELLKNAITSVTAILKDNNDNTISQTTYVSYTQHEIYGTYKTGAIEKYLTEGPDAIEDMKLAHWGESYDYDGLVEIFLHPSITTIGLSAYAGSSQLAGILIPNTVTTIEDNAFYNCTNLTTVAFEDNSQLTSLKHYTFAYCPKLNNVVIPDGVTAMGNFGIANSGNCKGFIFQDCKGLTHITLPASITMLGNGVFWNSALTNITFQGTVSQWNNIQKTTSAPDGTHFDWNQACGEIVVTCTDGTVIVPAMK